MTSEIRANTLKNRVGLGTVSFTNTGPVVSGIVTANSFSGPYNGTDIVGTGLTLTSTDTGSSAGPELKLFRNSASPADADYLGQIKFAGESDTGVERNYAKITGKILDSSNGTEDGIIEFAHIKAGSQTITGRWRSDSLQLLNGTALTVAGNATIGETVTISGDNPNITFADTNSNPDFQIYASNGAFTVRDSTNATNRFTINSIGNATFAGDLDVDGHTNLDNVSIAGITSVASLTSGRVVTVGTAGKLQDSSNLTFDGAELDVNNSGGSARLYLISGNSADSSIYFGRQNDGATGGIRYEHSNDSLKFMGYNNADKMVIDSSGNVLVGTTDTSVYNNGDSASEGIVLRNGEVIDIARKGDLQLTLNRQTNDGPHIAFYRSGAAKHFISTFDNDLVFEIGGSSSSYRKHRFNSTGDILLGAHGSRIFDDSSGTNVVVDIYGGTTAGKRGILALGGRTGSDDADIGTIQFVNENNNLATAANHVQSKLVASIDVKSETTDGNAGSDSGGHLLFSTKPETGAIAERLRIKSDGDIVATGNLSTNNLSGRNIVINGDMRVAQRATSASMSSSGNHIPVCDRWQYNRNGPSSTIAQVAEAPAGRGFKYSLKWTNTSPVGSIAAGNVVKFSYAIERQDIQRLGYGNANGKKATISFWAKGSLSGKIGVSCTRDSRIFSANEDIVANTWKFVEITIPVDTSTGFSGDDNATGFYFGIVWGAGSNSTSGAVGSWINFHNAYSAGFTAGQQGAYLTTNGSTFQITGVQMEIGSQSTPFEHKLLSDELANCQRYFIKDTMIREGSGYGVVTGALDSIVGIQVDFPVTMRATPNLTLNGTTYRTGGNANAERISPTGFIWGRKQTGSGTFNGAAYATGGYQVDAEL